MMNPRSIASFIDKAFLFRSRGHELEPFRIMTTPFGEIRYTLTGRSGDMPTVVLMPDPPNMIEHMQHVVELLDPDFRVLTFEAPGFGFSRAGVGFDFSIEQNADILLFILRTLRIENAICALTCLGALSGIMAARDQPELISGLVLGQTPSFEEGKRWARRVDFKGLIGTPFVGQLLLKAGKRQVAKSWYNLALPKGADASAFLETTFEAFDRGAEFSLASAFQAAAASTVRSSELVIEQKAIILWGTADRSHRKTDRHAVLDMLPNGEFVDLEQCGHFPDLERPERFAEAIREVAASL